MSTICKYPHAPLVLQNNCKVLCVELMGKPIAQSVSCFKKNAAMYDAKVLKKKWIFSFIKTVSGRSYQSAMLMLEVAYSGSCEEPCDGMESMGHFQSFFSRATNTGEKPFIKLGLIEMF